MPLFAVFWLILISSNATAQDEPDATQAPDEPAVSEETNAPEPTANEITENSTSEPAEKNLSRVLPNPASRRTKEVLKHLMTFQRQAEILSFSEEADTINGLYLSENTGKPQGGVLILHDIDQHAHWPNTIAPIREYLPDYGWNTLSLFFGNYMKKPLPQKPDMDKQADADAASEAAPEEAIEVENALTEDAMNEASDELESEEAPVEDANFEDEAPADELETIAQGLDDINDIAPNLAQASAEQENEDIEDISKILLQDMQERVDTGLSQLNNLGQFNLVIVAQGLSVNWAVESLVKRFEQNPELVGYALIIIDAKKSEYPDYDLNSNIAKLQIPILDIHTNKSKSVLRKVRERRNAITRTQNKKYWQIHLPAVRARLPQKHNMISRRVRGWLNTHAAGEEIDVKG